MPIRWIPTVHVTYLLIVNYNSELVACFQQLFHFLFTFDVLLFRYYENYEIIMMSVYFTCSRVLTAGVRSTEHSAVW